MKNISVVIVNYNTKPFLDECLENITGAAPGSEIIVVDNGSTDGSSDMVTQKYPDVKLITTDNKGLAAGNNLGLAASTFDYILYLGTDAYPTSSDLNGIIDYMESDPTVGVVTPKLVTRDGKMDWDAHRGFPTPWAALTHFSKLNRIFPGSKIFNRYFLGYMDLTTPHEIALCIAHFMMVRKEVFERIGTWDENFFLYGEDVDMCYRIKQAGWKIMFLPQYVVPHYKGVGVGIRKESKDITSASDETKKKIKRETTRAMRLFYEKHYKERYPGWLTGTVLLGIETLSRLREKGLFLG